LSEIDLTPDYDININYFAVLGVHYDASPQAVKQAYRKMARRYHPDVSKIHDAQSRFQEIAEAYEILTKCREAYCHEYDLLQASTRARNLSRQAVKQPETENVQANGESEVKSSSVPSSRPVKRKPSVYTDDDQAELNDNKQQPNRTESNATRSHSAYRTQVPIDGKDRVITYPLTLRYAIRLLNLGTFYIPGLKMNMKFDRRAFNGKKFRIEGRGYSGLFGGKSGDFLVSFDIKIDPERYQLEEGDIYSSHTVMRNAFSLDNEIRLDTVTGRVEVKLPDDYSDKHFIKVPGKGLPADSHTPAGDLYLRFIDD